MISTTDIAAYNPTATVVDGRNKNLAEFINNLEDVAPMGISVDNFPYVMMVALAALALAGYMALRFRRAADVNSVA